MANLFQKFLFTLSSLSPIILVFSAIYFHKGGSPYVTLVAALIALLLFIVGGLAFVKVAEKHTMVADFEGQVETIKPDTEGISSLIGAYAIPLISMFADNSSFELFAVIVLLLTLLLFIANSIPPTIFLILSGYSFYLISLNSGLSGIHLISRRKGLKEASEITCAHWLFDKDYWLLDEGEK